jgi:hypothetical protein
MYINLKRLAFYSLLCLTVNACSGNKDISLVPQGYDKANSAIITDGELRAVFIDNTGLAPDHKPGYNGIAELYHTEQDSTLFVPFYAGFNLEHIFSGDSLTQFFEPRVNPMTLYKKSEKEVLLYQNATPVSGVESLTEFKLVAPAYIDITFRCILHNQKYFKHGFAGFFWASYINNPPDRNIYFRGMAEDQQTEKWISAFSGEHGLKSTHRSVRDKHDFYFSGDFKAVLVNSYSDYRYTLPFYYGRFHNMVMAYFFDSDKVIRLSQSPTGGGDTNPAWDFQYLIPEPETGKEYSFKARMLYKPFVSDEDIRLEYESWIKNK